ncbi:polynucleotide kinase-phosphatase [Kutzneria kofuensis]|uniref:Polynucleotide kinase-phosphatase n=1 Tax=Kutzneria kofuensis TaxID=103725 RepID=A0A7W9NH11_9PSEU|nr:polynucleotide kinase-phosphatase [Kutzneria kofuensis]MBB5891741.1 polynucleotide kinase-phosphatase [Kutzneria kofuensis]
MTELVIPQLSLVALVGASGSGKSTFARKHFRPTEVISSDHCRGLVSDDDNDQSATGDAFDVLHYIAGKRLHNGRLTVVDATNVQREGRASLVRLAREHDVLPVAVVLDLPESVCFQRNEARPDRDFGVHVIRRQRNDLRRSLRFLEKEGFRRVHVLRTVEEVEAVTIRREPLVNDRRGETGPFDIIGDVHGCRAELTELLARLGYHVEGDFASHPAGRRAVFVGDLVDRGPDTPGVLRLVMNMVAAGTALCVAGNHENKLVRALRGRNVQVTHGLAESLAQLSEQPEEFRKQAEQFCYDLVSHYVLDGGKLVVAHAGLPERYQGRASGRVRSFALYGETTGETDEYGLPVRYPWANDYRGSATVVYGHTPVPSAEWVNNTICLDTGCVFGGRLTALRYPERELVSVAAEKVWYEPVRPLAPVEAVRPPDELDLTDVIGKRTVQTANHGRLTVRAENAAAAIEVMSRFAIEPAKLLYLPPTMAPVATSQRPEVLEHPEEAFAGYRHDGVDRVVCEEKHMGSRAVVLVSRDGGAVHTRTGRSFFDEELTGQLLERIRSAIAKAALWSTLDTDWLLLDCELLPWNAKAGALIREQYAAVGAAAQGALPAAVDVLREASHRGVDVTELLARTESRASNAAAYREAYERYCWPTEGLNGVRIAPFQLLASEKATYHDRPHSWHLALADQLSAADPELFASTANLTVDTTDPESVRAGVRWWEELTAAGGEGMVVKPMANLTRGRRGLVQPGLKVRGREYLRIIYGPDYTEPGNIDRLRQRGLAAKRSLAAREYALGIEGLERLARGEPLWRVHECVFAVLALESEPVDPRL